MMFYRLNISLSASVDQASPRQSHNIVGRLWLFAGNGRLARLLIHQALWCSGALQKPRNVFHQGASHPDGCEQRHGHNPQRHGLLAPLFAP